MVEAAAQRKYIIGGNWKSNGSVDVVRQLCTDTLNTMEFDTNRVEVVVAPISLHIASAKAMLNSNVLVSAQNISYKFLHFCHRKRCLHWRDLC